MEKVIRILKSPKTYLVLLTVAQLYGALKLFNGFSAISHSSKIANQIMIDQAVRLKEIDCQTSRGLITVKELNDASLLNGSVIEKSVDGLPSYILLITLCCFISIYFYLELGRHQPR